MPPRGRRGVVCHRWGTYVSWPANAPPIWRCHACGLYARLRGQAWYLVWLELHSIDGLRDIPGWTTARPPCKPPAPPFPSPWQRSRHASNQRPS